MIAGNNNFGYSGIWIDEFSALFKRKKKPE